MKLSVSVVRPCEILSFLSLGANATGKTEEAGCCALMKAGCRCAPFCAIKHRPLACLFTAWLFPTGVKSACKETMYFEERETGLEPATACLEGRVSQDRRSPGMKWLWGPIEQLLPNFVRL